MADVQGSVSDTVLIPEANKVIPVIESAVATNSPVAGTTPVVEKPPEDAGDDFDLDAVISSMNVGEKEGSAEEGEEFIIDFTNPKYAELDKGFKDILGIDLKSAYDQFVQAQQIITQQQQAIEQQAAQQTLSQLSNEWGVTGLELDKRLDTILKLVDKMPAAKRAEYDSIDGIKSLWTRIENSKGGKVTTKSNGVTGGQASPKRYTQKGIRDMMMRNPTQYNQMQMELQAAFEQGRVDMDM
jgi:hypothetical protein